MYKPAYSFQEYKIFFIAENSTDGKRPSTPERLELSNDEITAIRTALQKITRRRIPDADDAEDLVQDTLLTMIIRHPGNELEKGPLVWCQGILRNKVGNYYRKSRRHSSLKGQSPVMAQNGRTSPAIASPEITASNNELQSIIQEKISGFPSSIRQVMELLVSGLEAGEIADRLPHEPYQSVINRLYRGRKRLARELIRCGFGPNSHFGRNRKRAVGDKNDTSRKVS